MRYTLALRPPRLTESNGHRSQSLLALVQALTKLSLLLSLCRMAPYWEIYEQELHEKGFGFPVWHADPGQNGSEHGFEVKIGDVGYMS